MSILLGPYDKDNTPAKTEEQLLVFGYACKLYRDDVKAALESSGQLLIPWMGDNSLMVDRYDVRNRLDDKSQFGVKSNLPYKISAKEESFEDLLDSERYLALHWDDIRVEEQEEEERRRALEHSFHAINFSYNNEDEAETEPSQEESDLVSFPQPQIEHPPSCSVTTEEEDAFVFPKDLVVPEGIKLPSSAKLFSIIEKTALFVGQQGQPMEIIIKAKQKLNPFFSFLNMSDSLYPFYSHIKTLISTGSYVPPKETVKVDSEAVSPSNKIALETNTSQPEENEEQHNTEECEVAGCENLTHRTDELSESKSEDEDEGYLHPLLSNALNRQSKSSTTTPLSQSPKEATPPVDVNISQEKVDKMLTSVARVNFRAQSMAINAAPVLKPSTENGLGSGSQSTQIAHTGDPNQFYTSYPYPEGQSTPGYYGYIQPSHYHDVGGHHRVPLPPHAHESHLPDGPLPPHVYDSHYPHLSSGPPPPRAHDESHLPDGPLPLHVYDSHYPHLSSGPLPPRAHDKSHLPDGPLPPHVYDSHYPHLSSGPLLPRAHEGHYPPLPAGPHQGQYPPHARDHPGQYDYEAYYNTLSAIHIQGLHTEANQALPAPPPDLQPIINKMAEYVVKNGNNFESTVLKRHAGDSRFSFLNPWDTHHSYYIQQKARCQEKMYADPANQIPNEDSPQTVTLTVEKTNLQKLSSSGAVSFKLQPKSVNLAVLSTDLEQFTADDVEESEEVVEHENCQESEEFEPQAKKPRLDNGCEELDQVGSRVQEFLSTMKAMYEPPNSNQPDT